MLDTIISVSVKGQTKYETHHWDKRPKEMNITSKFLVLKKKHTSEFSST